MRAVRRRGSAALLLLGTVQAMWGDGIVERHQQAETQLRSRVVLVPIDVRVVDRNGEPVIDLTPADFKIYEDGQPQEISHFSHEGSSQPITNLESSTPPSTVGNRATQGGRTFLIVLGRGRLEGPAEGVGAAISFLKKTLLPEDRVGVVAYDRVSDLSVDPQAVIRLLDRYRVGHERIEALLDHWFSGMTFFYGGGEAHPAIGAQIDTLLNAPGLPPMKYLSSRVPDSEPGVSALQTSSSSPPSEAPAHRDSLYNAATTQDLERLHAAVRYLRLIDGEKHLIFLTEEGLQGATGDDVRRLARLAADSRVTISPIHTGGVQTSWEKFEDTPGLFFMGPSWRNLWANADSRSLAVETGGIAALYKYADRAISLLDKATRSQYLIGYYPRNATGDGRYRQLRVEVSRPGVTVVHRRSYLARSDVPTSDHREILKASRIAAAQAFRLPVPDLPVKLSGSLLPAKGAITPVQIHVSVDPAKIEFVSENGRFIAVLDVAVFVGTQSQRQIGEIRSRVDLNLTPESYATIRAEGVQFTATIESKGAPHYIKAVVYDRGSDLLGSAMARLR